MLLYFKADAVLSLAVEPHSRCSQAFKLGSDGAMRVVVCGDYALSLD